MQLEPHKQAEIDVRKGIVMDAEARKPFGFPPSYWIKWAVISEAFRSLGLKENSKLLDIGCGAGWTTVFLAESGYEVTGLDIVPDNVEVGNKRIERLGLKAKIIIGDMDKLLIANKKYDGILIFDSLHHTVRQEEVIKRVSKHLKKNGWVLFGEPSYLHAISPEARRVTREEGVIERGVTIRSIKKDCRKSGLGNFQRFFESTSPYTNRLGGFLWQLTRLVSANFFFAPQTSLWIAAQKTDD